MDEDYLQKIKKTLVVFLKERKRPHEMMLLGLVVRWEPLPVENTNSYDFTDLWHLNLFLPAETYATTARATFAEAEETIRATLNEITRSRGDNFISVNFEPELVDELTFDQEQLMEWLSETIEHQNPRKSIP